MYRVIYKCPYFRSVILIILSATPIIIYILYTHRRDILIATRYVPWPSSLGLFYYFLLRNCVLYSDKTYILVFLMSYTFNMFCCY